MPDINELYAEIRNHRHALTERDERRLMRAYDFAKKAHEGQERNNGEPYFNHVFAAAKNCARFDMGPTVVVAGLLHDTVEDTDVTLEDIEKKFGKEVASLVDGVTKLGKVKYQGRDRHVESLRKFFVASAQDVRVVIIKMADRIHNLETLQHVRPDKQKRIALESIEIHAALALRLGMAKVVTEIYELAFPYAYPKEYEEMERLLKQRKDTDKKYLDKVRRSLLKQLAAEGVTDYKIMYRVKDPYSLYKKLQRKEMDIDQIYDIIALRVMVPRVEDCYRILGIVHNIGRPLPGRIKDYISLPKPNGYQSLHTTIFTGDGGIAEIQIRTYEMHDVAEYGIAAHNAYKFMANNNHGNKKAGFDWIEQLHELQKDDLHPDEYMNKLKTDFFEDRIFIFTPDGDVIDLPHGATIVDFAYAIHSDIGNHLCSGKINGKHSAIKTELHNRDVVEIEHKSSCKPSSKWLAFTKTSLAQKQIRNALKDQGIVDRWFGK